MSAVAVAGASYAARRAAQKERVRILYRRALKDTLNWAVHRHLFYQDVSFILSIYLSIYLSIIIHSQLDCNLCCDFRFIFVFFSHIRSIDFPPSASPPDYKQLGFRVFIHVLISQQVHFLNLALILHFHLRFSLSVHRRPIFEKDLRPTNMWYVDNFSLFVCSLKICVKMFYFQRVKKLVLVCVWRMVIFFFFWGIS